MAGYQWFGRPRRQAPWLIIIIISAYDVVWRSRYSDHFVTMCMYVCVWVGLLAR